MIFFVLLIFHWRSMMLMCGGPSSSRAPSRDSRPQEQNKDQGKQTFCAGGRRSSKSQLWTLAYCDTWTRCDTLLNLLLQGRSCLSRKWFNPWAINSCDIGSGKARESLLELFFAGPCSTLPACCLEIWNILLQQTFDDVIQVCHSFWMSFVICDGNGK